LTFHEYAHAWAAHKLGDDTAERAGRLSLNPLVHISWTGLIILVMFVVTMGWGFGWAKPVPFNPYNLRNPKRGTGLIAIAGPLSNIIQAVVFSVIFKIFESQILGSIGLFRFFSIFIRLNIVLAGFNLIPIPPLDGSKVLFSLLPNRMLGAYAKLEQYGFIIFIIILVTPVGDFVLPLFFVPLMNLFKLIFDLPFF